MHLTGELGTCSKESSMSIPLSPIPPSLCLPQHDRDLDGRSRQIEAGRATYRYAYDKANIRGLAMTPEGCA